MAAELIVLGFDAIHRGCRRVAFLSSISASAFNKVSNPTQAVNSENTNHFRTRSKYNAIKKNNAN